MKFKRELIILFCSFANNSNKKLFILEELIWIDAKNMENGNTTWKKNVWPTYPPLNTTVF